MATQPLFLLSPLSLFWAGIQDDKYAGHSFCIGAATTAAARVIVRLHNQNTLPVEELGIPSICQDQTNYSVMLMLVYSQGYIIAELL